MVYEPDESSIYNYEVTRRKARLKAEERDPAMLAELQRVQDASRQEQQEKTAWQAFMKENKPEYVRRQAQCDVLVSAGVCQSDEAHRALVEWNLTQLDTWQASYDAGEVVDYTDITLEAIRIAGRTYTKAFVTQRPAIHALALDADDARQQLQTRLVRLGHLTK